MQKKHVKVGEVYEYRTAKYGNGVEARVTGPWQAQVGWASAYGAKSADYRPEGFPVELATPGDEWCPDAADARHLTPIDEAKKRAKAAADAGRKASLDRKARGAAWGELADRIHAHPGVHACFVDWEGRKMTLHITDPNVAKRIADALEPNP